MIKVRICWEFDYVFWHLSTSLSISFICICNNYSCIVNQRHLGYNCPDFVSGKGSDSMFFQSKIFRHRIKQEREDLISCFHPLILKNCPEIFPQNDLDSLCTHPAEGYKWYEKEIQYRRRRGASNIVDLSPLPLLCLRWMGKGGRHNENTCACVRSWTYPLCVHVYFK